MKVNVEFPISVGEKLIYVSNEYFPLEPSMKELYVINFGYNRYHKEFFVLVDDDLNSSYGAEVYLNAFGVDAFLLAEVDKAKEVFNARLEAWKKKNN